MEAHAKERLQQIRSEISRLEATLALSPDDAFGYLELGCLFAETDQRERAIEAFRSSYAHRTGGQPLKPGTGPLVEGQLREAFEVTVNQAPAAMQGKTRRLFEEALLQQEKVEAGSQITLIAGLAAIALLLMAAIAGPQPPVTDHGYWPGFSYQAKAWDLPADSSGYWPDHRPY